MLPTLFADDKNETNEPVEDAAETNINGVAVETREDTPSGMSVSILLWLLQEFIC